MSKPFVTVQVRALGATGGGYAVFLGDGQKAFLMLVDRDVGAVIALAILRCLAGKGGCLRQWAMINLATGSD